MKSSLTHLQLNTCSLQSPKDIVELLYKHDVDIACLQEVLYPSKIGNPLLSLLKDTGYKYIEAVGYYYNDIEQLTSATAIVTKLPVLDYHTLRYNTTDHAPKVLNEDDIIGSKLVNDHAVVESMASRGLKHAVKSMAVPVATLDIDSQPIRVYSMHLNVSSWATETMQMYDVAQGIHNHILSASSIPVILSGDFNLQQDSYSVKLISQALTYHCGNLNNTLHSTHKALEKDFPDGLAVDHVFSDKLQHLETRSYEVDFTDHHALISRFQT